MNRIFPSNRCRDFLNVIPEENFRVFSDEIRGEISGGTLGKSGIFLGEFLKKTI